MAWKDTVALMRCDVEQLGEDPIHSWRLMLRVYASLDALGQRLAATLGVSSREFSALLALWDGGRCTMSELADRIGISRAAITTMVDRLDSAGLVRRDPDPGDRRRMLASITERCDEQFAEAFAPLATKLDPLASSGDWPVFAKVAAELRLQARAAAQEAAAPAPRRTRGRRPKAEPNPESTPTHW